MGGKQKMGYIKRGHTVQFDKPYIKEINDINVLIIEKNTKGHVREVLENKIYINIPTQNFAIVMMKTEMDDYLRYLI